MAAVHYNAPPSDAILVDEDGTIRVLITDDGTADGTPVNCTGFALKFVLKLHPSDAVAAMALTTGDAEITIANGAATGDAIDIAYTNEDTENLSEGEYHYALWRTDAGEQRRLAWGTWPVRQPASVAG